ncbi:MAG TPA: S8/S53 family peptidase [Paracoccaceae bacterium]|nr:S8/S53 family peptidase [Paracoccaceae bacterium]
MGFFLLGRNRTEVEAGLTEHGLELDAVLTKFKAEPAGRLVSDEVFRLEDDTNNPYLPEPEAYRDLLDQPLLDFYASEREERGGWGAWLPVSLAELRDGEPKLEDTAPFCPPLVPTLAQAVSWRHWPANGSQGAVFGDIADALRLIRADKAAWRPVAHPRVNAWIVDRGLNAGWLGGAYGGGLGLGKVPGGPAAGTLHSPNVNARAEHGHQMVALIRRLAGREVRFYDAPLIPPRISKIDEFVPRAFFGYLAIYFKINFDYRNVLGPWIVLSPWGFFDRRSEVPRGKVTEGAGHAVNGAVRVAGGGVIGARPVDLVFAAGNGGQFFPDRRTGPYEGGPGRSIWFPNGLGEAITVGAVRADGLWVGTASEGPAPELRPGLPNRKPDFAAPGWFGDATDRSLRYTGTSAASAIVAGAVALVRQRVDGNVLSPAALAALLRRTARKRMRDRWNPRTGEGVLDLAALAAAI